MEDVNDKLEILKTELHQLLKRGEDWIQQLPIHKQRLLQQLPIKNEWIQHIPPNQIYVAIAVVLLTIFFLFLGQSLFLPISFILYDLFTNQA